jgi:hypothetical protein
VEVKEKKQQHVVLQFKLIDGVSVTLTPFCPWTFLLLDFAWIPFVAIING